MPHSTITVFSGYCNTHKVMLGTASVDGKGEPLVSALRKCTRPEMTLRATIAALKTLSQPTEVTIRSAETYITKGIPDWLPVWKDKGWKNSDRKIIQNLKQWQELDSLLGVHTVTTEHISEGDPTLFVLRMSAARSYSDRAEKLTVPKPRKKKQ